MPQSPNIFGSIREAQWWLGYWQFLIVWDMMHNGRLPGWAGTICLSIASFSGPLGILPAMAAAIVMWRRPARSREALVQVGLLWIGPMVEFTMALAWRTHASVGPIALAPDVAIVKFLRLVLGWQLAGNIFPVAWVAQRFGAHSARVAVVVGVVGLALMGTIWTVYRPRLNELVAPAGFLAAFTGMVVFGARDWAAGRYLFLPSAVLAKLAVAALQNPKGRPTRRLRLAAALVLVLALSDAAHFRVPPEPNDHWARAIQVYDPSGKALCAIQIPGLQAGVPPMLLPCRSRPAATGEDGNAAEKA